MAEPSALVSLPRLTNNKMAFTEIFTALQEPNTADIVIVLRGDQAEIDASRMETAKHIAYVTSGALTLEELEAPLIEYAE